MNTPVTEDQLDTYTAEAMSRQDELIMKSGLYAFIGRVLEEEIDRPFLDLLRTDFAESLEESGLMLTEEMVSGDADKVLDILAEEFTGLFVQPGAVLPYRSVFETGRMYQEPCDAVAAAYQKAGFEFETRLSGEFPDHIGVMLGFVSKLCAAEAEAIEHGDEAKADHWRDMRNVFIVDQLGPWGLGWCHRARLLSEHPFYASVLALTEEVLMDELKAIAPSDQLRNLVDLNRRPPVKLDYDADFRKASGL